MTGWIGGRKPRQGGAGRPAVAVVASLLAILATGLAAGGCRNPLAVAGERGVSKASLPPDGLPDWGKKQLLAPGDPALARACVQVKQRYLWIDRVEVMPSPVDPGGEMNHRFIYTFCPQGPVERIRGTLTTRVVRDGRALITDTENNYTLTPGQWAVDARIVIPPNAEAGAYTLETGFVAGGAAFKRSTNFAVR